MLALRDSLGALLEQTNKKGKENTFYYLSHHLISIEANYLPIEKHYLALIFMA